MIFRKKQISVIFIQLLFKSHQVFELRHYLADRLTEKMEEIKALRNC